MVEVQLKSGIVATSYLHLDIGIVSAALASRQAVHAFAAQKKPL
jgi:D-serine dehydratase